MDESQAIPEPKISLVEVLFIGLIFALFDTIEIIIVLFALDDFWIIDTITAAIFFYLLVKGVPPMRQFLCWLVELIPWLGALPLLTIGWGLTVWGDRHPSGAVAKIGVVAGAVPSRLATGTAAARGTGARSLGRMERAEKKANAWRGAPEESAPSGTEAIRGERPSEISKKERPSVVKPPPGQERRPTEELGLEEKKRPEGSQEDLGEEPTPFEKLERLTQEPLPEPPSEEEEEDIAA